MSEEIEMYFEDASAGSSYIESLARTRLHLTGCSELITKLDLVIIAELDLALMGAEKAKSEILKKNKDDVVRPIK